MFYLKKQKGFTIVETMIVLGVTGVLFVSVSLLISGQTERYRYRDSMYRLQQQVQNTISDTKNGQFVISGTGTSDSTYFGKIITFDKDSSQIKVNTIVESPTEFENTDTTYQEIPGGLKYLGAIIASAPDNSITNPRPPVYIINPFDVVSRLTNGSITSTLYGTRIDRSDKTRYDTTLATFNNSGFVFCFEGQKRGSLELGAPNSGSNVKLNLVDSRCD